MSMLTDPASEVREIRDACRRLLGDRATPEVARRGGGAARMDADVWKLVVEAGWIGLGIPESAGGAGFGVAAQAAMFAEVGRALAPVPLLGTAGLAAPLLAAAKAPELDRLLGGSLPAALVLDRSVPPLGTARVSASTVAGELRLTGSAAAVLDGAVAQLLVVVAAGLSGPVACVLSRDAAGMDITVVDTADVTRPLADLEFDGAVARALVVDAAELEAALGVGAVSVAAEMVGTADRALELTVEYLKTRHQFGKPIGSFQALKHRVADLATDLALANELVFACAAGLDEPVDGDRTRGALIAATVHRAAEVLGRIGGEGVQLHGAIGFTEEHDIGLYYRRALAVAAALPAPVRRLESLAELLGS